MAFSLLPTLKYNKLTDVSPSDLAGRGIKLLILDLDNTVSPYKINEPTAEVTAWRESMEGAGITLFIVSNNHGERPRIFSEKLKIPYIKRAKKPFTRGIYAAMEAVGAAKSETALAGDQIYTDMLAANFAGITGILVEPIKFSNPLLAVRYFFELPFRHIKKER